MMNGTIDRTPEITPRHHGTHSDIERHILDALRNEGECDLEDLTRACPSYTWNQVFLEVDRLSRTGELRLFPKGSGLYSVALPTAS